MRKREDLRPYQVKCVDFIKKGSCALWVDMGLGKTVSTLTAIVDLFEDFAISNVLIIAPKRVAEVTWADEIKEWAHTQHLTVAVASGTPSQRTAAVMKRADITCISRDNVLWLTKLIGMSRKKWYWDMVVIDESSSFKSPDAKRFKALRKLTMRGWIPFMVQLTGTPASKSYLDIWSQMLLIDKGQRLHKSFSMYKNIFFQTDYMGFSYTLLKGAKDAIQRKIADKVLVMKAEDYIDLPEFMPVPVLVPLSVTQTLKYQELERDYLVMVGQEEIAAVNAAVLYGKLCQFATGDCYDQDGNTLNIHDEKIDALKEIVESADGAPILLAFNFQHERDKILRDFSQARVVKTTQDIRDWNAGKIPLAIAHPQSIGHGLNLQDGGHIIVWYSVPSDLEIYLQFNKRLHRSGQTNQVVAYHLITEGTIEEKVLLPSIKRKDLSQKALIAGVLAYARK